MRETIFITHIHATDIVSGLRRLPAGFYVSVQIDRTTVKTTHKPVFVDEDEVKWDVEILLPSDRSSLVISFAVYASFELGPMLGSGESLHQFNITVGDILDRGQRIHPIDFLAQQDETFLSYPSLRIVTERRICDINDFKRGPDFLLGLNATSDSELEQQTDTGHLALRRFRQFQNQSDLDGAIACFELVRDTCPSDHLGRSAALFNLATAKFIRSQANDHALDLDASIILYHEALLHRTMSHPDHCATAVHLTFALLTRFRRQGNEEDMWEAKDVLCSVVERSLTKNCYAYQAACLASKVSEIILSNHATELGTYQTETEHLMRASRAMLLYLPDGDALRPTAVGFLGNQLFDRFKVDGNLAHIHEAISTLEFAVRTTPDRHPQQPDFWYRLGKSFSYRFKRLNDSGDMDKEISALEEAMRLIPNSDPNKLVWVNELLNAISRRIKYRDDFADIVKSTWIAKEALRLAPEGHPDKPAWFDRLGNSHFRLFELVGDTTDINKSISAFERAMYLTPNGHPNKLEWLDKLARVLLRRFECLNDRADIDKAILKFDEARLHTPANHPDKRKLFVGLGDSLLRRFQRFGNLADLDASILMAKDALHLTPNDHDDRPSRLSSVASSLLYRFEHRGDLKDIQETISMFEEAIKLVPTRCPKRLHNLGNALLARFDKLGEFVDLEKAISIAEEANQLTPDGDPQKPSRLSGLGSLLLRHFEQIGNIVDIDRSISLCDEAVRLTPDGNSAKQARLNNLGLSLYRRFQSLGNLVDIDRSISLEEQALKLIPGHDHPDKPARLNSLGSTLLSRFERTESLADLDKSISMKEEGIHITPEGHPEKPIWLDNLGNSLLARFERSRDISDINKSIELKEEAIHLMPDGHPHKPIMLANLGSSFRKRLKFAGDLADVNRSLSVQKEAISLTPDGHPSKPGFLMNIGITFGTSFELTNNPSDLSDAISHLSAASCASIGPIFDRFFAARKWIAFAHVEGNSRIILDAFTTAIGLLPQLAWLGIPLLERHRVLHWAADIARDAAAAALEAGQADKAVEWLEEGRSIVWNQFLQLRTPIDELRIEHPTLADQFQQVSQQLEKISSRGDNSISLKAQSLEEDVKKHHELALRREKLLLDIRSLAGFERFLLPKSINQLSALVNSGPVVYLNASEQRCDALIITGKPGHVISIPLTRFSYKDGERLFRLLLERDYPAVSRDGIPVLISSELDSDNLALQEFIKILMDGHREGAPIIEEYSADDRLEWILSFLWDRVVNPVVKALDFLTPPSRTEKLARIFWCPTGPFAFLPIHAAGHYGRASTGTKIYDFAISSYIPTLSTLAPVAEKDSSALSSEIRLVTVGQPPNDGQTRLRFVKEEIDYIKTLSSKFQLVSLQESHGTIEDVMEKMKDADWVHFACHGVQDPINPLDSGLCLADQRRLKLSDIIQLSRPQGGLAFLSACQTAHGNENLTEESVHLAAGMLLAGYGSVIATMWSIMDRDAPKVARDVYEHLFRDGKVPDSAEAAEALHYAVQYLRNSRVSFTSWVPFIHFGR